MCQFDIVLDFVQIREELRANGIDVYPQKEFDEDAEDRLINDKIRVSSHGWKARSTDVPSQVLIQAVLLFVPKCLPLFFCENDKKIDRQCVQAKRNNRSMTPKKTHWVNDRLSAFEHVFTCVCSTGDDPFCCCGQ